MLERWTRAVLRWRILVIACWVAVVIVGALSAARLPQLLSTSLAVPGSSSQQANTILERHFGESIEGSFTVVQRTASPSERALHIFEGELALAARALPAAHVSTSQSGVGVGILYGTIVTSLDLQQASPYTGTLRRALTASGLGSAYVTGAPALQHDVTPILAGDLRRGELIAILTALVLLTLVLGLSVAVLIPLVVAACTMTATLAIVYLLAHKFLMVLYIPNVVELIGLGLAVDYSLLIVHRFREELADGDCQVNDAVAATMTSAGRAVVFSGIAVAVGLSALLIIPVPFLRSLGVAGFLVPVVSVIAALTLQPALLSLLGRRGMRSLHLPWLGTRSDVERRLWARLGRFVIRRRLAVVVGSAAVLVAAAAPLAWLQLTPASETAIPQSISSARGLALLRAGVGPGVITPIDVVLDARDPGRALTAAVSAATLRLAHELLDDQEVFVVAIGDRVPYVDATGQYGRLIVVGRDDLGAEATQRLVREVRDRLVPAAHFPAGVRLYVGGAPAQGVDFLALVYGTFPWVVGIILAIAYVILLRAFRSLLLPLMAVLLDVVSVAAAYGLLVVVFRLGVGADVLGLYRVSQIEGWVPVFLFAVLFGLSMDYEVFFVTRMREARDSGLGNAEAVTYGLAHTGRVVSAAALIMVGALSGLATGRVSGLQELGVGLALGVLVDATIVRGLLMPGLMAMLGRWNWWLPASVARVARVKASPLACGEE
ncbi:MAG: MMPL family transporter [Acidimicrobiales bacterium]